MKRPLPLLFLLAATACLNPANAAEQSVPDPLAQGFATPPDSAKPRVWWHWMNGNITKEGIKLDLEWMHRIGLGGFQNFDASLDTPQVVDKRLAYMRPEWKDAFKYAIDLGDQLGMEMAIASSPGWSETGGPWVTPSQGMKKYVWSESSVEGGKAFTGTLNHPPTATGLFQYLNNGEDPSAHFYADSAVIAFQRPGSEVALDSLHPKVTASSGQPDLAALTGMDPASVTKLAIPAGSDPAWIQFEFAEATSVRALTIATKDLGIVTQVKFQVSNPEKYIEASDDGTTFRTIQKIPEGGAPEHTISFPEVKARFFRVAFRRAPPPKTPSWMMGMDPAALGGDKQTAPEYTVLKVALHGGPRVNRFEEKAAFATLPDLYSLATPSFAASEGIPGSGVLDLTSKLKADGGLDWTPPAGDWIVLRFGYSLLGTTNHPATAEATGLEVDKLNATYVKAYMDGFLASYEDTVGKAFMGKRGIKYVVTDSWEAGSQNWTDDMLAKFKARRGYDAARWMPVLAGFVVDSSEASDRFLWDFRKTIADLISDEHYGQVQASLAERGIGHYGESHEGGRAYVSDGMEVKKLDDIPMSAMWTQKIGKYTDNLNYNADDRESASVAHIYGQNLAAAESMTASGEAWAWSPSTLKPTADAEFLNGINRIVIHESAHQPLVGKAPGLTLGPFGQWFNRNETWAEQAGPWIQYLARTSYMLQQGRFGADLLYYYGEDSNLTAIFNSKAPAVPMGYGFDYINADGLIHEFTVANGRIETKSGMSYSVLGLDPYSRHMSLPVLRAISKLVESGAIVAGPKPIDDPSLADDQEEFATLSNQLFGNGTGIHALGSGKVYAGQSLESVFTQLGIAPDFDYSKPEAGGSIQFVHRRIADGDIYFLDNRSDHDASVDGLFRVEGKAPEFWHAETGTSEPASYSIASGRTTVPLHLEPWGTVFVVFRHDTSVLSFVQPKASEKTLATLSGSWDVAFQEGRGAPATVTLDKLESWSDDAKRGVKYYSGSGTYTKTLDVPGDWVSKGSRTWIDLGDVKNLAEVSLNGKVLATVWHAPYRVELTGALKEGSNQLSVKVVNAWVNRLIGDEQPGAQKFTFADIKPYKATSKLQASGLIGPVQIISAAP
ncbi:MAG TPA: glycosyl hydrolase [Opitutaceae bacterium]|nr:glycosyl hydrolase [Opitutaceae bacterium]